MSSSSSLSSNYSRRAHHAGNWYDGDKNSLDATLTGFLSDASKNSPNNTTMEGIPRACICPHAGFSYSGPTAAYSYLALHEALDRNPLIGTIVVLHPSHHVYLQSCAISGACTLETPLMNLTVDAALRDQLLSTKMFQMMDRGTDEHEHSGEMQYPFIAKVIMSVCPQREIKVLPIMVGSMRPDKEELFGRLIASCLADERIFTIISSDFCHYGKRFNYTPKPQPSKSAEGHINEVYEYIEYLDRKGMDLIELQRPGAFADYLREYANTICGRHPIAVWLNAVVTNSENGKGELDVRFVRYAQSSRVRSGKDNDSSVSYASAVARSVKVFE
jgi:AmmeMemoRadiSam system protein B